MTRADILTALRQAAPEQTADMSDDELLYNAATQYEQQGILDQYPALKAELEGVRAQWQHRDDGVVANAWTAAKRGFAAGRQQLNVLEGPADPTNAQDIADAELTKVRNPASKEMRDFTEADGFVNSATAFLRNPVKLTTEIVAESLAQSIPALAGSMVGAAVGGEHGMAAGPYGAAAGSAAGVAAGSFASEYANRMLEVLQSQGMDLTDPVSIAKFFNDEKKVEAAREVAVKRAIPVALFNGVTAGFAGRFVAPLKKIAESGGEVAVRKVLAATAKELALQAAGGMAGEVAGDLATGSPIEGKSLFMQGVGAMGMAPVEVLSNVGLPTRPKSVKVETPSLVPETETAPGRAPLVAKVPQANPFFAEVPAPNVDQSASAQGVDPLTRARTRAAGVLISDSQQYAFNEPSMLAAMKTRGEPAIGPTAANDVAAPAAPLPDPGTPDLFAAQVAAARLRAAQLRGTTPGEQMTFRDPTMRAAMAAKGEPVIGGPNGAEEVLPYSSPNTPGQMRLSAQPEAEVPAAPAPAAPATPLMEPNGQMLIPEAEATPRAPVPGEVTPVPSPDNSKPVGVQTELKMEPMPRQLPPADMTHITRVETANQNLEQTIKGNPSRAAAVIVKPDQSMVLVPLRMVDGKAEAVISERPKNIGEIKSRIAENNGISVPYVDKILYHSYAVTADGRLNEDLILKMAKKPETQQLYRKVAQQAIDLGMYDETKTVHPESLGDYMATVVTNRDLPAGQTVFTGSAKDLIHAWSKGTIKEPEAQTPVRSAAQLRDDLLVIKGSKMKSVTLQSVFAQIGARAREAADTVTNLKTKLLDESYGMPADERQTQIDSYFSPEELKAYTAKDKIALLKRATQAYEQFGAAETPAPVAAAPKPEPVVKPASVKPKPVPVVKPVESPLTQPGKVKLTDDQIKKYAKAVHEFNDSGDEKVLFKQGFTKEQIPLIEEMAMDIIASHHVGELSELREFFDKIRESQGTQRRVQPKEIIESRRNLLLPEESDQYRAPGTTAHETKQLVDNVVYSMLRRGVDVVMTEAGKMLDPGGMYNATKRTAALIFDHLDNPSTQSLLNALHEVTHDILEHAPEPIKLAFHDFIERVPRGELAFYKYPGMADPRVLAENGVHLTPKQLLIERGVEHLAVHGINQSYSRGVLGTIFRAFKDMAIKAAIYLQTKLVGEGNTTGRLAEAWFHNEVAKVLAGDRRVMDSFLERVGRTPEFADLYRGLHDERDRVAAVKVDMNNGYMSYQPTGLLDNAKMDMDAALNAIRSSAINRGEWMLERNVKYLDEMFGPDIMRREQPVSTNQRNAEMLVRRTKAEAESSVAVANALSPVFDDLLSNLKKVTPEYTESQRRALRRQGTPVPTAIATREDLMRTLNIKDPQLHADEITKHFEALLEEQFGKKPEEGTINPALKIDDLTGATLDLADLKVATTVTRWRNKFYRKLDSVKRQVRELSQEEERNRAVVSAVNRNLADATLTRAVLNKHIAESFAQIKRDLRSMAGTSEAFGEATAILEALDKEAGRAELTRKYTERVLDGVSINELPLNTMVRAMHDVAKANGLDLAQAPVSEVRLAIFKEVRAHPDSPLASLVELGDGAMAKDRGTALLSAMLNFVKNEKYVASLIDVQMREGAERIKAINELRTVTKEHSDTVLDQLADQVYDLSKPTADMGKYPSERPTLTEKQAHEMLAARDEALAKQVKLARLRQNESLLTMATKTFDQLVNASESRLEVGSRFVMHDGSHYLDAGTPDMDDKLIKSAAVKNELRLQGESAMTRAEMQALIDRNQAWIDARKGDPMKQTSVYHSMVRQNYEMRRLLVGDKARAMVSGFRNGLLSGIGDLFLRTGTKSGERISNMFNQWVGWQRLAKAEAEKFGKKYEVARAKFEKLSGVDPATFRDVFFDDASWVLDNFLGIGGEKEAFAYLHQKYSSDPMTARYWNKKGAAQAFFELMQTVKENNQVQDKWARMAGAARVEDPDIRDVDKFDIDEVRAQERRRLDRGVPGYTRVRNIRDELKNWADAFRANNRGDSIRNVFANLELKLDLKAMTDRLSGDLKTMFDQQAWDVFLEPLLTHDQGGMPTPLRPDGVRAAVLPHDVQAMIDAKGHDLLAVIDGIYDKYAPGQESGRNAYRMEVMRWLKRRWDLIDRMTRAAEHATTTGVAIPSLGIDARTAALMPKEWLTYPQYTPEDHMRTAHNIFATGAFGKEALVLRNALDNMTQELSAKQTEVRARGLPMEDLNHPLWQALKRDDPAEYKRLANIAEYKAPNFAGVMRDVFNTERDLWTMYPNLRELFGGMTVGMVSGLKSAIKNPISTFNLINAQHSASPEVLKTVAGSYAKTGRLFFNSVLQLFGVDLLKNNPMLQSMVQAGAFDTAGHTTINSLATGERGIRDNLNPFARTLRIARTVFGNTRLSALDREGTAPSIRLLNPFQYTQQLVNMANTWQLMQTYHDMAQAASGVYMNNPRETRLLTAKDVGMKDTTAFTQRMRMLMDNGLTLEELAKRVAKGQDIMDDRFVMAMNNISTGVLANEASLLNRPLMLSRSPVGRMAGTFVGWSLDQTTKTLKLMETPEGALTVNSVARGLGLLSLAILPASLAYASLLDQWDELIERKQNRLPVTDGPDAWTEALVSVGTMGLLGETIDGLASYRQGSSGFNDSLSLDNRIVLMSSLRAIRDSSRNLLHVGTEGVNYANIVRPFTQAVGANGIMQNAYVLDRVLGNSLQSLPVVGSLVKAEADVALRTNFYNYLRVAGREAGLEVRGMGGGSYSMTPVTPQVTNMVLAAIKNDPQAFQDAFRKAVEAAAAMGELDPYKTVVQRFSERNPLKTLFNGRPMAGEVAQLLSTLSPHGREVVESGLANFNAYSASLGAPAFMGAYDFSPAQYKRAYQAQQDSVSLLDSARAKAAALRRAF